MAKMMRTVSFYTIRRRRRREQASYSNAGEVDWNVILKEFSNRPWEDRLVEDEDVRYDTILDGEYPLLTITRNLDPSFLTLLNDEKHKIEDFNDQLIKDRKLNLGRTAVVLFYPRYSAIGLVSGDRATANVKFIELFLNTFIPSSEYSWEISPIYSRESLKDFEENIEGLYSAETRFNTTANLFAQDLPGGSVGEFCEKLSRRISQGVEITLSISIPKQSRTKAAMRNFKEEMRELLPWVAGQRKTAKVRGEDKQAVSEELNLIPYKLTEKAEVGGIEGNRLFSDLVNALVSTCRQYKDRVYSIIEEG